MARCRPRTSRRFEKAAARADWWLDEMLLTAVPFLVTGRAWQASPNDCETDYVAAWMDFCGYLGVGADRCDSRATARSIKPNDLVLAGC